MLTKGEDVEAHALKERGWSILAIARHLGRDPKTIRGYLSGERIAGERRRAAPDPIEPYKAYLLARFADNPHIWATALYDEVKALGYGASYVSFARQLRLAELRPHCEACSTVKGGDYIEISHPPGEELQWDWFHRRAPWGGMAAHGITLAPGCDTDNAIHLVTATPLAISFHAITDGVCRAERSTTLGNATKRCSLGSLACLVSRDAHNATRLTRGTLTSSPNFAE